MCYGLPVRSQELGGRVQGLGVNAEPRAPGLFNQPPLEVEEGNLGERLLAGAWVLTGIAKCAATYLHMTLMCGAHRRGLSQRASTVSEDAMRTAGGRFFAQGTQGGLTLFFVLICLHVPCVHSYAPHPPTTASASPLPATHASLSCFMTGLTRPGSAGPLLVLVVPPIRDMFTSTSAPPPPSAQAVVEALRGR